MNLSFWCGEEIETYKNLKKIDVKKIKSNKKKLIILIFYVQTSSIL